MDRSPDRMPLRALDRARRSRSRAARALALFARARSRAARSAPTPRRWLGGATTEASRLAARRPARALRSDFVLAAPTPDGHRPTAARRRRRHTRPARTIL